MVYTTYNEYTKFLKSKVIDILDNNDISIDEIDVTTDKMGGSEYVKVKLQFEHFDFYIEYEEPGCGFNNSFAEYVEDLVDSYNDGEAYIINEEFTIKFIETLQTVKDLIK